MSSGRSYLAKQWGHENAVLAILKHHDERDTQQHIVISLESKLWHPQAEPHQAQK